MKQGSTRYRCVRMAILMAGAVMLLLTHHPACGADQTTTAMARQPAFTPHALGDGWAISTPEAEGLDAAALAAVYAKAQDMTYIHSFLVLRHGKLVAERYFNGYTAYAADSVKSVSKSILSALAGIALQRRHLKSVEQNLATLLPDVVSETRYADKIPITLKHLLTMHSGLYSIRRETYRTWVQSANWVTHVLEKPLEWTPGTVFSYSTGDSHLVAVALTKAAGISAFDFAQQHLFQPLGIRLTAWKTDPQGYAHGGNDMFLTPRDMAKFGLLYLNKGRHNGQQIVPAAWVAESTATHVPGPDYGYYWCKRQFTGHEGFSANGYGGQFIVIVPSLDLVIVTTAKSCLRRHLAGPNLQSIWYLIEAYIEGGVEAKS